MKKAIICHFYYPDFSFELLKKLQEIQDDDTTFFVNVLGNSAEHIRLVREIRVSLKKVYLVQIPNKGRDIGAKIFLIDMMLQAMPDADITLIIHDKKSPHLDYGHRWRDELFTVVDPKKLRSITRVFMDNPKIGLIGSGKYIQNEYLGNKTFACNSSKKIGEELNKFQVKTDDYDFIAGNVFWIRTGLLRSFFQVRSAMKIRSGLETGNVLDFAKGTYVHAWERIMSWIATSQGYTIYGL